MLLIEIDCFPAEMIFGSEHGLDGPTLDLGAGNGELLWFVDSCESAEESGRYDEGTADHDGRECSQAAFGLELANAVVEAEGKLVGSLASPICIGLGSLAGVGSQLELVGAMVPVVDLAGQSFLDGGQSGVNAILGMEPNPGEVFGHSDADGVIEPHGLKVGIEPF